MAQVYYVAPASATPVDRAGLRDAWIAFLGRWEWEWFCTFTFRDMVHPEAADKRFRLLLSEANRVLYGHRWHKHGGGLRWVRALEYQKRDVIHYHALVGGVRDLRRLTWMDRWYELAGIARIEPITTTAAVVRYVSKYVVKGGEIDLGGPLKPSELPLFLQAASRPGDYSGGSKAGSVKAAASAERSEGSLDGFCRAPTLSSPGREAES
jgi:hypothetical protein